MKTTYLIAFGCSNVSPLAYFGWNGELPGIDLDLINIQSLAKSDKEFIARDNIASAINFKKTVSDVAKIAEYGDRVTIYFSGHGTYIEDSVYKEDAFLHDQAICLFDGLLTDNEIFNLLAQFRPGVNLILIIDSCHSGSMYKLYQTGSKIPKSMPIKVLEKMKPVNYNRPNKIVANLKYFGACQENQYSYATPSGSLFTYNLYNTHKQFPKLPYKTLFYKMLNLKLFPPEQSPKYTNLSKSQSFDTEIAFS